MDVAVEGAEELLMWEGAAETFAFLAQVANSAPSEESVSELMSAVRAVDDVDESGGYGAMRAYADECVGVSMGQVAQELAVDWTLLFRGMNRQSGPRPPYAGVWLSDDGVGIEEMCAVNAYYAKAGLGAGGASGNRHDYFGVELEFVSRMARRIAEGDERAPQLLASFLDECLLSWFDSFKSEAAEKGKTTFWKGYLDLVGASLVDARGFLPA